VIDLDDMWSDLMKLQDEQFEDELIRAFVEFGGNARGTDRTQAMVNDTVIYVELLRGEDGSV